MPRKKSVKIEELKVVAPVEEKVEEVVVPKVENPSFIKTEIVELNGRKYTKIHNLLEGTTKMEPLLE